MQATYSTPRNIYALAPVLVTQKATSFVRGLGQDIVPELAVMQVALKAQATRSSRPRSIRGGKRCNVEFMASLGGRITIL